MSDKKKRPTLQAYVTPRGAFAFPNLQEPDYGTEKYKKKDGEYNLRLCIPKTDPETDPKKREANKPKKKVGGKWAPMTVEEWLADMQKVANVYVEEFKVEHAEKVAEAETKGKAPPDDLKVNKVPWYGTTEKAEYNPDCWILTFKAKASYEDKKTKERKNLRPPFIKGPDGKDLDPKRIKKIGGGTIGKVNFEINPYTTGTACGVTLRLGGTQLFSLKTWGGTKDAAEMGFDSEEGSSEGFETEAGDDSNPMGDSGESFGGGDDSGKEF